jgi:Kdo2-lipid IVA lauroyltransferase/acyltransferase
VTPTPTPFRHHVEYRLFLLLRGLVSVVPEVVATGAADLLGVVAGSVLRIRRRDVDRHLALAFPEWDRRARARVARASYRHLAREAVVLFRLGGWPAERMVSRTEVRGLEQVRRALAEHGGAIILTGHLGNWEVAAAAVAARGVPVDVVAKGMSNRRFERSLFAVRARLGVRVVEMSEAPREVLRSLRGGRAVAIAGDQNAHRNGVFVPFFGAPAATARGGAVFALRTGVPVFMGFGSRLPGRVARYEVDLFPLHHEVRGEGEQDVEEFLAAYMRAVDEAVRAAPEQYFWQHKRWKTRPSEEPGSAPPVQSTTDIAEPGASGLDPSVREGHEP